MKEQYKKIISDMLIFGLGAFGSKFIMLFLLPLYTIVLSKEEFGIADLVITTAQLLLPIISIASFNGLLRFGLSPSYKKEEVLTCSFIIYLMGCIITFIFLPFIEQYDTISEWRWYILIYAMASYLLQNSLVYLKVLDKNKIYSLISIFQVILLVGLNILFLVYLEMGIKGYLLSMILSTFIAAFVAIVSGKMLTAIKKENIHREVIIEIVLYSLPFVINDISWWIIQSSDKVMVEMFLGAATLGLYTTATKIPSIINAISSVFIQAWTLASVKEFDSGNNSQFYTNVFKYYSICIITSCMLIIIFIKPFMEIYIGEVFFDSWKLVPLLLVAATFSSVGSFISSLYAALKKSKNLMYTTLIGGLVNVIGNYLFIMWFGVWGAIASTVIAYSFIAIFRMYDMKKYINIDYDYKKNIPLILLLFTEAIAVSMDYNILTIGIIVFSIYTAIVYEELILIKKIVCNKLTRR